MYGLTLERMRCYYLLMNMNKMQKIAVGAIVALIVATLLSFVVTVPVFDSGIPEKVGTSDAAAVLDAINEADEIFAEKALFSFGDNWTIYADGEKVGSVHGEFIKLIGDAYSLYTTNGHFVGAEEEKFRIIAHEARIFDADMNETGSITRNVLNLLQSFDIKKGSTLVGTMKQNFSLGLDATIKTPADTDAWKIERKVMSLNAKVTVKRVGESEVTGMDALWMALVSNEVFEAEASK